MTKTVVITGASAGVGRATAHAFARRGDAVALLARGQAGLSAAAEEVRELGGRALAIRCDVTDAQAVDAAAARVEHELGPIDVWVNNAMVSALSPFAAMEPEEFARITAVAYGGTVHGTQAALRHMVPRDAGVVVQVGSALAYRGIPLQSAYCGAKHAVQGFTESVRCELLHDRSRVRLTMVQMPALNTPQFSMVRNRLPRHPMPVPPIYEPEVAADAIVWASEHRRREVWVGASTPLVLLGNALMPTAADHFLAATAYDGQQAEFGPDERDDYLFEPRREDPGVRGPFGDEARGGSWQLAMTKRLPGAARDAAEGFVGRMLARVAG